METVFLLHGALGAKDQLQALETALSGHFRVHTLNFSGHGTQPFAEAFSIEQFADELIGAIEVLPQGQKPVSVFGYSMGGYVAAYAALQRPGLFEKIITLATKWQWDAATAARENSLLNPAAIEAKIPSFAQQLAQRHGAGTWKTLLQQTGEMLTEMGKNPPVDLAKPVLPVTPALLLIGDCDKTVSVEETTAVFRKWPGASLSVLPATPHPFEKVDTGFLSELIKWFLKPGR